jgi:hypothetical protein
MTQAAPATSSEPRSTPPTVPEPTGGVAIVVVELGIRYVLLLTRWSTLLGSL